MALNQNIAFQYLQDLSDELEDEWDTDYTTGALLIEHPNGQFLLNYHGVMDQLWLSSPTTGAHHFSYRQGRWLCTRTDRLLKDVLRQDLNA